LNKLNTEASWLIKEMDICRAYCSMILRKRKESGFHSVKYPLISVNINRYFLPEFRDIIAEECNLIGYLGIPPVEYNEEVESYDKTGQIVVELDTSRSNWQNDLFQKRNNERKLIERKILANKK